MSIETIITLIVLGVTVLGGIVTIIVALVRGEIKKFIEEKMAEADQHTDWSGEQKRNYVIEAVKERYKIAELIINIRKFIEYIIKISKEINYKG